MSTPRSGRAERGAAVHPVGIPSLLVFCPGEGVRLPYLDTLIGSVAALCTTASYIPQLQKSWATGQTDDLSLRMLLFLLCGLSLWVIYGFLRVDIVIIVANGISVGLLATILYLKLHRSHVAPAQDDRGNGANRQR